MMQNSSILKYFLLSLTLIFSGICAVAQDSTRTKLSLAQAIDIALENNYQIKITRLNEEIAAKQNKWSEAGLFPTLSLNAGLNNNIQDNTNNPFTFQPGRTWYMSLTPTANLDWTIFSGLGIKFTKQRLEQLEAQTKGNSMVVVENTIHQIMLAYYNAVLQEKKLNIFKENLKFSQNQVKYYELKQQYNQANSLDLLQYQNQYYTDSSNFLMQEYAYKNATRNLNLLMIQPIENTYEFTDAFPKEDNLLDLASIKEVSLSNNQNLKNQYINLELQKTNTKIQQSFLYPVVSVSANAGPNWGWFRQLGDPPPGQEIQTLKTQSINYGVNLNLRYTIFNNWKTKRASDVSKIQEQVAQLNIEEMKIKLDNNISNFHQLYQNRLQLKEVQAKNEEYSKKVYELGKEQHKANLINSIQLTTLQKNNTNAQLSLFESQYNLIETYLELYKISGAIVQKYSQR